MTETMAMDADMFPPKHGSAAAARAVPPPLPGAPRTPAAGPKSSTTSKRPATAGSSTTEVMPAARWQAAPEDDVPPSAGREGEFLLDIEGMHCASCIGRVEKALAAVPGVESAHANLATNQAVVRFEPGQADAAALVEAVAGAGYHATLYDRAASGPADPTARAAREAARWGWRLLWSVLLLVPIVAETYLGESRPMALWNPLWEQLACATLLQAYVGWPFYLGALHRARRLGTNMDTLVAIGTTAAYASGAYEALHAYGASGGMSTMHLMDAGIILTVITLGRYLEARAKGRASLAIRKLLELAPPAANVQRAGKIVTVSPAEVAVGETIVVRPGERVPLDALVTSGRSSVDESWLTGESMPLDKSPGSRILAGTINLSAALAARVVRTAGQTALAQVIELVERRRNRRPTSSGWPTGSWRGSCPACWPQRRWR